MATLQSLPPELIIKILEHSIESDLSTTLDWDEKRRRQLRSTSLVARSWTEPSQRLLWRNMAIDCEVKVARLTERTTPRMYRTETLSLAGIAVEPIIALLDHLRGVDDLVMLFR
ncbi:hypothetical protein MNV49_002588 [Pseudohyphozyma bogoriensis]|nr:hypothetical protein MNV49_002588 [Pseudohyphozyma bogoriensis]